MKRYLIVLLFFLIFGGIYISSQTTQAYGECSEYGLMITYDSYTHTCKCMSGYVFGKNFMGEPYCVSADQVCRDKLGIMSRYNSLSDSCECSYGYVIGTDSIGRTQCISRDDQCHKQLGYNSSYNILKNACVCRSGYIIDGGTCRDGDTVCRNDHGLYAEYNSSSNRCECESGYTFDDNNQCVKKQNNVYFYLKEVDTDNREAIIKSEYDYTYYLIRYGIGCYSSSIKRYLRNDIVVNLGIDFDLDTWDKIVLQDDNETCDITSVHRASSSDTLVPVEESDYTYVAPVPAIVAPPTPFINSQTTALPKTCPEGQALTLDKKNCVSIPANSHAALNSKTDIWECDEGYKEVNNKCIKIENVLTVKQTQSDSDAKVVVEQARSNSPIITASENSQNQQGVAPQKSESKVKSFFRGIGRGIGNSFKKIGNWFK